ncbi:MAG TPA: acyl-CoA dehydrogenase [Polyangiaceae bacterium]|jgi:alkylation response protein AidB-like acyl-CoA dehydrogenase|nr:MAG: Acryloyl-CoA reductase (NADH) [Deltaproteobacteria bacterium ADurb.Bin207]HNS96416.1 acyl-CoA dehydrogenase [Polyangiaceae bacterium]HNZ22885.1 acyl-CoA dehydrogenase [Polyangiaceae bacterium]HOD21284.1 acyl-CoA dehydrogenase [Polyangiaceae bacterium]HOE48443.1 acyl-CoA dehydrogenase [Polyangiaceae bacterium]
MHLEFTETQSLIQQTARDYAQRRIVPVAAQIDRESRFPKDILKELAELGLMGVNIPASLGGAEAGAVAYVLAMIEISRACASTAVAMSVTNMVGEVITNFGTEEQRNRYVPMLTSGSVVAGSFALSEGGAGSDPGAMRTTAHRDGNHWVLNGEKMWISTGDHAGVFVVWARTADRQTAPGTRGISCFLVEPGTPGFSVGKHEEKMGLRGSTTVSLSFEDCRIPASALLGEENRGFRIAMMALDGGRLGIASQAIGIASAALEETVAYVKQRKQFDRPIADFQAIQWQLADSRTELDAARMLTFRAAWLKENKKPFSQEASMAKLFASETAVRVCNRCVQMHGGYGFTKDYAVERHLRDCRVTTIYEGTSEIQRTVISRSLLR